MWPTTWAGVSYALESPRSRIWSLETSLTTPIDGISMRRAFERVPRLRVASNLVTKS